MGDYLMDLFFEPVPASLRPNFKFLVYLIRGSEALILIGLFFPWYHSKAFGYVSSQQGIDTGSGLVILVLLLGANTISHFEPVRVPLSRYAWGMAFVGALTFLLAYGETGGDPEDNFALDSGIYITMAGGILRFVLGVWVAQMMQKEERVIAFLAMQLGPPDETGEDTPT